MHSLLQDTAMRAISSVGSEHLVYTQGVGSSSLSSPTKSRYNSGFFLLIYNLNMKATVLYSHWVSYLTLAIWGLVFPLSIVAQQQNVTIPYDKGDSVTISILAVEGAPGLTTAFGHSQFRIVNHTKKRDDIIDFAGRGNWEILSYLKDFFFGDLYYDIFTFTTQQNVIMPGRRVEELILDLSEEQKEKMMDILSGGYFLEDDAQYKYDFLHKNCTILMRDVLEKVYPNVTYPNLGADKTFRQIYAEGLTYNPWIKFFSDIVLGPYSDRIASSMEQMFNPVIFYKYMKGAKSNGKLIASKRRLLIEGETPAPLKFYQKPGIYVWALLLLEILLTWMWFTARFRPAAHIIYDRFWFFIAAFFSILILALWVDSNYDYAARDNWNLLWLNPLFVIMLFLSLKRATRLLRVVSGIIALCIFVALLGWKMIPQTYNIYFLPVMLLLLFKAGKYLFPRKKLIGH